MKKIYIYLSSAADDFIAGSNTVYPSQGDADTDNSSSNPIVNNTVLKAVSNPSGQIGITQPAPSNLSSTVEKYKTLYPNAYGDVNHEDIYPGRDTPIVGYTDTPSWGKQPLFDTAIEFPLGVYYKNQRAIQELMLAGMKTQKATPEKVTPYQGENAAPNAQGVVSDITTSRLENLQDKILKAGGRPGDIYTTEPYVSQYQRIISDDRALSSLTSNAYKSAEDFQKSQAAGDLFTSQKGHDHASAIHDVSDYDLRDVIRQDAALGNKSVGPVQALRNYYDSHVGGMHTELSLGHATAEVDKNLQDDARSTFESTGLPEDQFSKWYGTFLKKGVSDDRLKSLVSDVAKDHPNDFYISDPSKTPEQNKADATTAGKNWTTDELYNSIRNKRGITETITPDREDKRSQNTVIKEEKDTNAVVNWISDRYKDALKNGSEILDPQKNIRLVSGANTVSIVKGDNIEATYKKDDWTGIAKGINAYASDNSAVYKNVSAADVNNTFETAAGKPVRDIMQGTASDNPYKTTPESLSIYNENGAVRPLRQRIIDGGPIPIGNGSVIQNIIPTSYNPNIKEEGDHFATFELQVKGKDGNVKNGVLIPSKFVPAGDEATLPVDDKNNFVIGRYKPNKDGSEYTIITDNGEALQDKDKNPITVPGSYVRGIGRGAIQQSIQAHSSKSEPFNVGTNNNTNSIGNKPIVATPQSADDLIYSKAIRLDPSLITNQVPKEKILHNYYNGDTRNANGQTYGQWLDSQK
jgi:hypothetical protein